MCGIVGVLSQEVDVTPILKHGIHELQNRGYDSIGSSRILGDGTFYIEKKIGHHHEDFLNRESSQNGIAHTRWATHGGITVLNAHPHLGYTGDFSLIHNGIIENHELLRRSLQERQIQFVSETDSEVIVHLLSYIFSTLEDGCLMERICRAIHATCLQLEGTFGLVLQYRGLRNNLFCIRYGSPLLVGMSESCVMVVSEKSAFDASITNYAALYNHDLVVLHPEKERMISRLSAYTIKNLTPLIQDDRQGYEFWTHKEIMEQPDALRRCLNNGSRIIQDERVHLGGLDPMVDRLRSCQHLVLLGCGTSFHACSLVTGYFRRLTSLSTVQVCDGSEFDIHMIPRTGRCCLIVVSQSGETLDLLQSMHRFRAHHSEGPILGVVNVVDSMIATEVDAGVYTNCGKERGVASTKSFSSQVIVLLLLVGYFASLSGKAEIRPLLLEIQALPDRIQHVLFTLFPVIKNTLAPRFRQYTNMFVIGKSADFYIAMEASLKIKEITYIHSEAYSSSSLKHGPFALLTPDMLVILISTVPEDRKKLENAYQEIAARHAPILVISQENIQDCPYFLPVQYHHLAFLEANCILQVLALELSILLGHNPDFPRNLAKVVTVE